MSTVRVVRFDFWIDAVFDARLARERHFAVEVAPAHGDDAAAWAALRRAHVYQISAAKNELPQAFHVGGTLLERCPQLLCVSSSGAGYDTVDVDACTRAGVLVMNQAGGNAPAVAEMTLGLMLAVSRRIVESDRKLRSERGYSRESLMGSDLRGKTLGIVGIGHAGSGTVTLARAFGMRVLAMDPFVSLDDVRARGAEPVDLDTLVRESDIVSLHCPRDSSTIGLFGSARFAAMKRGALFISTARGGIHDEAALYEALASGHLGGAGLDVWEPEPPPLDHPLLSLPNVVATFHTAGVSHEGRRSVAQMAAEQIVGLIQGVQPPRLINPQAWQAFLTRCEQIRHPLPR